MIKTHKITYKVFLFERVKKKIPFLDTETYPLQIRLTAGPKTVYLKSRFFSLLQLHKYQRELGYSDAKITIDDIAALEDELIRYLLYKNIKDASLEAIKQEYNFLSNDILHELDERFKQFLVDFFYAEQLPAYSMLIQNDGANHSSEFILQDLGKSLQPAVFEKLLAMAVEQAPPYIPLVKFSHAAIHSPLPVFPVYQWQQEEMAAAFDDFIGKEFPEYRTNHPAVYINQLVHQFM